MLSPYMNWLNYPVGLNNVINIVFSNNKSLKKDMASLYQPNLIILSDTGVTDLIVLT